MTRAKYPDAQAFADDMPRMLRALGFSARDARYLADRIVVEPARGSGHAWGASGRWEPARLRTRVGEQGMDYKGYNIAVHEFGHNVEQTLDLYDIDYYMLNGVPNTAYTEALAFIFQKRDLQLLGFDYAMDDNTTLDIFWGAYRLEQVLRPRARHPRLPPAGRLLAHDQLPDVPAQLPLRPHHRVPAREPSGPVPHQV